MRRSRVSDRVARSYQIRCTNRFCAALLTGASAHCTRGRTTVPRCGEKTTAIAGTAGIGQCGAPRSASPISTLRLSHDQRDENGP
jgi:hypothetical protein